MLPPLKPIPIKERMSVVFVEKGEIDVVMGRLSLSINKAFGCGYFSQWTLYCL